MRRLALLALVAGTLAPVPASASPHVHHLLFRSMATGDGADEEQLARCAAHVSDRTFVTRGSDLDYRIWGMGLTSSSGLIVDHNASDLGPGFLCSYLPDLAAPDVARAYAYMEHPWLGEFGVEGPCRPTATVNTGETFWHCRFEVLPDPEAGILGGMFASNSVLVLTGGEVQWQTGSLWTGYVVTSFEAPSAVPAFAPELEEPLGGSGGSFFAVQEADPGSSCSSRELVAPAADPSSGLVSFEAAQPPIGTITPCVADGAGAVLVSLSAGLSVEAAGTCSLHPSVLGDDVSFRTCSMHIAGSKLDGVLSGTVVGGGLVWPDGWTPMTWTMFVVRA